jgi:hypothetical protein
MSETIRTVKSGRFSIIDNQMLENESLSLQAKGLQAYLLSRPNGWGISPVHLATTCKGGVSQIKATLKELEIARYIHREQLRDDKGQMIGWVNWIYENPNLNPHTLRVLSKSRKSACGKSACEKSTPIKTELNKTELNKNSPDRTSKKKSADAEAEFPIQEASLPIHPPESPTNVLDVQTHQFTREGSKQSILERNESTINSPLAVDPDLTPEREGSAAHRPTPPLRVTHRDRAAASSLLHRGISNSRWRNLDEFKSFREYATEWAAIRFARPELGTPGQAYDDDWIQRVLANTANCADNNSPNLTLWTAWINKAPESEIVNQDIPEFTPIPTSQATLDMVAKYKAECAAKAAAKAQAEKDEAIENARWEIHHEN